jgi:hypothetical protein
MCPVYILCMADAVLAWRAGFLQGPGTPPTSVQRIRDGLNSGKGMGITLFLSSLIDASVARLHRTPA